MKLQQVYFYLILRYMFVVSDEKEKYDPNAFRDNVLQGFISADSNLEQVGD